MHWYCDQTQRGVGASVVNQWLPSCVDDCFYYQRSPFVPLTGNARGKLLRTTWQAMKKVLVCDGVGPPFLCGLSPGRDQCGGEQDDSAGLLSLGLISLLRNLFVSHRVTPCDATHSVLQMLSHAVMPPIRFCKCCLMLATHGTCCSGSAGIEWPVVAKLFRPLPFCSSAHGGPR